MNINITKILFTTTLLVVLLSSPSHACMKSEESDHSMHTMTSEPSSKSSTSVFDGVMSKMHKDMMIKPTGNVDVDFVKGMIPHHQGAIDMAKIVLKHGKDPAIRKLATDVIKAQESEIKMMQNWLNKNHKPK